MANATKKVSKLEQKDSTGALVDLIIAPLAENVRVPDGETEKSLIEYIGELIAAAKSDANTYADGKIAALVGSAPEALDTLEELAAALKDNADIVDTLLAQIGTKISNPTGGSTGQVLKKTADGEEWADENEYVHPANHPASMITEDTTHRFVTDSEKNAWDGKANVIVASAMPSDAPNGTICLITD